MEKSRFLTASAFWSHFKFDKRLLCNDEDWSARLDEKSYGSVSNHTIRFRFWACDWHKNLVYRIGCLLKDTRKISVFDVQLVGILVTCWGWASIYALLFKFRNRFFGCTKTGDSGVKCFFTQLNSSQRLRNSSSTSGSPKFSDGYTGLSFILKLSYVGRFCWRAVP